MPDLVTLLTGSSVLGVQGPLAIGQLHNAHMTVAVPMHLTLDQGRPQQLWVLGVVSLLGE